MIDLPLAEKIVSFLNELVERDADAIAALVGNRVPCNGALGEHPTVQTGLQAERFYEVGMLGVLNGLCGVYDDGSRQDCGAIAAVYSNDGDPLKMETLRGFRILKNEDEQA